MKLKMKTPRLKAEEFLFYMKFSFFIFATAFSQKNEAL